MVLLVCRIKVCEGWDHILINDEVIMKNIMMECMPSSLIYKYLYNICYIHR